MNYAPFDKDSNRKRRRLTLDDESYDLKDGRATNYDDNAAGSLRDTIKLHPLLSNIATLPKATNPLKQNARSKFDATSLNPYIDQANITMQSNRSRPFQLNPKGKFMEQAEKRRELAMKQNQVKEELKERAARGILPNINLQEDLFRSQMPPLVEWWDRPYLRGKSYKDFYSGNGDFSVGNEVAPITHYIQHPVPIAAPWDRNKKEESTQLFLTKKELKRKRRNERQIKHRESQDRIKLGLDPPPPPKVKLSNLMNVLTNEAIQDPTGVEMKVRQDIHERFEKHMKENEARKLNLEQKAHKREIQLEKELSKGLFTTVYKVDDLSDGQNFYKVDINAKQLGLVGILLENPRFNLIIVEGSAKSLKFYKKLMMNRIKWQQSQNRLESSDNRCILVWEGQVNELSFQKWSVMHTQDDDEAYRVLNKFGHENYWREGFNL